MQGNWKDRLYQWDPEPPAGVWERLSEELAEGPPPLFAQKLHQFSEAPPANTWDAISAQLDAPVAAPVVKLFPKNKIIRYGSVAASVLLAFFLFRQVGADNNKAGNNTGKVLQQQTIVPLPGEAGVLKMDKTLQAAQTTQQHSVATHANTYATDIPALHFDKDPMPTLQPERTGAMRIYEVLPAAAPELNDGYVERYIVVPIAEDAAVRLPKKLYDLFRCGEIPAYAGCVELMSRIRQQSAAPSFVTTADFPGLLELVQQQEPNQ
jgi:hypothetical protein